MNLVIETVERSALRRASGAMRLALSISLGLFLTTSSRNQINAASDPALFGVFVGSSPGGESISQLLHIPADVEPPVQWELKLYQDQKSQSPAGYKLSCNYIAASSKASAKRGKQGRLEKEGVWKLGKGTKFNPEAMVFELDGALSLFKVDTNILHLLNPDRGLMVGNGGWSFTLNRTTATDRREGNWSIARGTATDPTATVYRLEPAKGEETLLLLKGDDDVLFFLDQKRKPLVGHADFSYTLNRRTVSSAPLASGEAQPR